MAEYVGLRIEEFISVIEELQRSNILTQKETRKLIDDITNFEYKIEKRERKLDDILEYIRYESKLLKTIKDRRKKINFQHKKQEIEDKLIARIHSQFGSARLTFGHDLKLWKAKIEFLQSLKLWPAVSSLFNELLSLHGLKYPHLFKNASNFEFSINPSKGIETARLYYQYGLRQHPKNMDLRIDAFSLELKYIDYLHHNRAALEKVLSQSNGEEIVTELKLVKLLYKEATINETQAKVFIDFVLTTQHYDFAATFREEIIEDIKQRCAPNEATMDSLAKLALQQHDVDRAIQEYKLGLELKPTEMMYDYFLNALWMVICKVSKKYIDVALPIFQQAHDKQKLSLKGYLLWSRVHVSSSEKKAYQKAKQVLRFGIQRFDSDPKREVWNLNIELIKLTLAGNFDPKKLQDMIHSIKSCNIPEDIWKQSFLAFALAGLKNTSLENFVETVRCNDVNVQAQLRTLLLKHIGNRGGRSRDEARTYYEKYQGRSPLSFSFHQTMIEMELLQMDHSTLGFVRQCYQHAMYYFGSSLPEFWIKFIEFEERIGGDPSQAAYYREKALKMLSSDDLRQNFIRATMHV